MFWVLKAAGSPEIPESGEAYIGAVGQMISAVLQTAGLYTQNEVLTTMGNALISAGSLVYIVSVIAGVCSVALFGNYRAGLYLFLGPALFYFMLTSTVSAKATELRFGARSTQGSDKDQLSFLNTFVNEKYYEGDIKVSWFYARFDKIVSSIVQGTVAVLIDTKNKEDLINAGRERVFTRVLLARSKQPEYLALVSTGVMGDCGRLYKLETALAEPRLLNATEAPATTERNRLQKEADDIKAEPSIRLREDLRDYVENLGLARPPEAVSCGDIWRYVTEASIKEGEKALEALINDPKSTMPWAEIKKEVVEVLANGAERGSVDEAKAVQLIAAYILKNTLVHTNHSALTGQIASKSPWSSNTVNGIFGELAEAESYGGYLKIVYFAGSIPYIQGLLLFLLTAAFPFFCIFLLMPGRASAFLIWMSLWVWVKSWDIGFALTHVIRDLLWEYMGLGVNGSKVELNWEKPQTVYAIVTQGDPLANFNMFTTIVGVVTVGVPAVSAHLCLGANNLFDAFKNSIDGVASRFAAQEGNAGRRRMASREEIAIQKEMQEYALGKAREAANDPGLTAEGLERAMAGDGTVARHVQSAYVKARYDYMMNNAQNRERWERLGMFTRRKMVGPMPGMGRSYIEAMVNEHNEQFETRHGLEGSSHVLGGGSEKPGNTRTDIDMFNKNSALENASEQDGAGE